MKTHDCQVKIIATEDITDWLYREKTIVTQKCTICKSITQYKLDGWVGESIKNNDSEGGEL